MRRPSEQRLSDWPLRLPRRCPSSHPYPWTSSVPHSRHLGLAPKRCQPKSAPFCTVSFACTGDPNGGNPRSSGMVTAPSRHQQPPEQRRLYSRRSGFTIWSLASVTTGASTAPPLARPLEDLGTAGTSLDTVPCSRVLRPFRTAPCKMVHADG